MNQKSGIYLLTAVAVIVLVAVVLCMGFSTAGDEPVTITIFHTNDMHGHIEDLAYVSALRSSIPNSLLVDAGDATQGTLLATTTNGTAIITLMNAAGYDVMTLGNHEFDKGSVHAAELSGMAEFPVLSANTIYPNGTAFLNNGGHLVIETGGKRIGFFGITTTGTNGPYSEFICTDEIREARNQTSVLKEMNTDLIVALVHVGNDPSSSPTSYDLAAAVPGIDLIIDGHSHTIVQDKAGNTTIVQTGSSLQNLGLVNVTFTASGQVIETSLIPAAYLKNGTADAAYASLYTGLLNSSSQGFEKIIGKSTTILRANGEDGTRLVRIQEMPLGDLAADSLIRYGAGRVSETPYRELPMVALVNGGGVREDLRPGNITLADAYTILPFGNFAVVAVISPKDLYAAMENGVSGLPGADGRFPQVGGMKITVNASGDVGERIVSIEIPRVPGEWQMLDWDDCDTEILLATTSYIISGAEGYSMLSGKKILDQSSVDASVLADYISVLTSEGGGSFTYAVPERIHMLS